MAPWKQLVVVALIAIGAIGYYAGYIPAPHSYFGERGAGAGEPATQPSGRPASSQVPVVTAPVEQAAATRTVRALGSGVAIQSVTLFPRSSGIVEAVEVRSGQTVSAGDALIRLDSEDERIAIDRARAQLEAAERTVSRYQQLAETQSIPAAQLDEARTEAASLRADVRAGDAALQRRTIRAPFDGIAGLPGVSAGDSVDSGTELITLDDRSILRVDFEIPERYASELAEDMPFAASTPSIAGAEFDGHVAELDSRVDPVSRTIRVRGHIPNPDDRLRPGMSFAVTLAFDGDQLLALPANAVLWDRDGSYVWIVRDGKAERQPVEIVRRSSDTVQVNAEIEPGEAVIVEGLHSVRSGVDVTEITEPEAAS